MALQDITNAPRSVKKSRKRLSDGTPKDYEYTTSLYTFSPVHRMIVLFLLSAGDNL